MEGDAKDVVQAAAAGTVLGVYHTGSTYLVKIDHGSYGVAFYAGLGFVDVQPDEVVLAGAEIGTLPARPAHPVFRFSLEKDGKYENPAQFVTFAGAAHDTEEGVGCAFRSAGALAPVCFLSAVIACVAHMALQVAILFACVLLHELGHARDGSRIGIPREEIELLPFGGVAKLSHGHLGFSPRKEAVIAIAGPAVNLALGWGGLALDGHGRSAFRRIRRGWC